MNQNISPKIMRGCSTIMVTALILAIWCLGAVVCRCIEGTQGTLSIQMAQIITLLCIAFTLLVNWIYRGSSYKCRVLEKIEIEYYKSSDLFEKVKEIKKCITCDQEKKLTKTEIKFRIDALKAEVKSRNFSEIIHTISAMVVGYIGNILSLSSAENSTSLNGWIQFVFYFIVVLVVIMMGFNLADATKKYTFLENILESVEEVIKEDEKEIEKK